MPKEYDFAKLKELKNPYPRKKNAVGINLSPEVLDYFKGLAEETGLPYQKLIDLYLLDCARKRKKLEPLELVCFLKLIVRRGKLNSLRRPEDSGRHSF